MAFEKTIAALEELKSARDNIINAFKAAEEKAVADAKAAADVATQAIDDTTAAVIHDVATTLNNTVAPAA